MANKKKVLIVCNYNRDGAAQVAADMEKYLAEKGYSATTIRNGSLDRYKNVDRFSLLVTLSGDGAVLAAARKASPFGIPILAVNFGTIGFMTEVEPQLWKQALDSFVDGTYVCRTHTMLDVEVIRDNELHSRARVLNEGVIHSSGSRTVRLDVDIDGENFGKYIADGLIVSTTTGSTAYSSSAGGPIVHPDIDTIILSPVCPYSFIVRPVVVSPDKTVTVRLEKRDVDIVLVLDGQTSVPLKNTDVITFRRSECKAKIITLSSCKKRFFCKLRERMSLYGAE